MNRALVLPLALAALLLSGCVEVRASSRARLSSAESRLMLVASGDAALQPLVDAFARRGFSLIDRRAVKDATMLSFKGGRTSVSVVTGNQYSVSGSSTDIGSIFYARVTSGESGPHVELWGKPTLAGTPVCSDEDAAWTLGCSPLFTGALWPGLMQVTGREEAETIRGIMLELDMAHLATLTPAPPASAEPAASANRCTVSELPEWKTASAAQKKELLKRCQPVAASGGQ